MDTMTKTRALGPSLRKLANNAALAFAVFVVVTPVIFVMLWMLSLSFKNEIDNIAYPPIWIPESADSGQLPAGVRSAAHLACTR